MRFNSGPNLNPRSVHEALTVEPRSLSQDATLQMARDCGHVTHLWHPPGSALPPRSETHYSTIPVAASANTFSRYVLPSISSTIAHLCLKVDWSSRRCGQTGPSSLLKGVSSYTISACSQQGNKVRFDTTKKTQLVLIFLRCAPEVTLSDAMHVSLLQHAIMKIDTNI